MHKPNEYQQNYTKTMNNIPYNHTIFFRCVVFFLSVANIFASETNVKDLSTEIANMQMKTEALKNIYGKIKSLKAETDDLIGLYKDLEGHTKDLNKAIVLGNNLYQISELEERLEVALKNLQERLVFSSRPEDPVTDDKSLVTFQELKQRYISFEEYESSRGKSDEISAEIWEMEMGLEKYVTDIGFDIIREQTQELMDAAVMNHQKSLSVDKPSVCVSKDEGMKLVEDTLSSYANEDNHQFNLALHSNGAQIVYESGFTSNTYTPPDAPIPSYWWHALGGLPQVLFGKAPIQPAHHILSGKMIEVGSYWAFEGEKGKITIKFGNPIRIESVSLHHVSQSIGNASSAPRHFDIIGRYFYRLFPTLFLTIKII